MLVCIATRTLAAVPLRQVAEHRNPRLQASASEPCRDFSSSECVNSDTVCNLSWGSAILGLIPSNISRTASSATMPPTLICRSCQADKAQLVSQPAEPPVQVCRTSSAYSIMGPHTSDVGLTGLVALAQGYLAAMSASAFSFVSMLQRFGPHMNSGGAAISLTYLASVQIVPGAVSGHQGPFTSSS